MKIRSNNPAVMAVVLLLFFCLNACKKKEDEVVRIQNIVPQEVIDDLTKKGMTINQGNNPPTINAAFRISPYELISPYSDEDPWRRGKVINDYFFKFYGQSGKQEITYDYYNDGKSDVGAGEGAFIVGKDNKFTIFSEDTGVSKSIPYKSVVIISGEIDGNVIKNFQYAFVFKEKTGDELNEVLIPVNAGRVWRDGDLESESISNFRMSSQVTVDKPGSAGSVK